MRTSRMKHHAEYEAAVGIVAAHRKSLDRKNERHRGPVAVPPVSSREVPVESEQCVPKLKRSIRLGVWSVLHLDFLL